MNNKLFGFSVILWMNLMLNIVNACEQSATPPSSDTICCGIDASTSNNRILGGLPTSLNQFPWLALIRYKSKYRCGGSLISGFWVLTTAHCIVGDQTKKSIPYKVVLGEYEIGHDGPDCVELLPGVRSCSDREVRIDIQNSWYHERFITPEKGNDIGLLKLKKMAPYTEFIRPICLPTSDLTMKNHSNLWLTVAGWGTTRQWELNGEYQRNKNSIKRYVQLPFLQSKVCSGFWNTPDVICAGGEEGKDTCFGDSGGPLMYKNGGQYEVVGVVSYGNNTPCGTDQPGVYTNVYKYMTWINNIIKNNE